MGFRQLFPEQDVDFNFKGSFHLYTDGSCLRNGAKNAPCGWAYVCVQLDDKMTKHRDCGGCIGGTNNQMEMTAVLRGLEYIEKISTSRPVTVYSDSRYVIDTLKGVYSINKNQGLWNELLHHVRQFKHIQFIWIKGHADDPYNTEVDRMANGEAKKQELGMK